MSPSLNALDLTNLGTRIGDKPLKEFTDKKTGVTVSSPMAPATMARAERCLQRFGDFPAVLMPDWVANTAPMLVAADWTKEHMKSPTTDAGINR